MVWEGYEIYWGMGISIFLMLSVMLVLSLYRLSSIRNSLQNQQDQLAFMKLFLDSDARCPLWLYPGGQIQADPAILTLLRMESLPERLADLDDYLPALIKDHLQPDALHKGNFAPIYIFKNRLQEDILCEIKALNSTKSYQPSFLLWFQYSTLEKRIKGINQPTALLEGRLTEITKMIDRLPQPIWSWDQDGQILWVNEAYVKAVDGKSFDQTVYDQLTLIDPRSAIKRQQLMHTLLERRRSIRERHYAIVDGHRRSFMVTHQLAPGEQHILSVAQDITAEEEALSELSRVLESQSVTLNRLASPVAIFGPDKALKFYNQAFRLLTGIAEERLAEGISHEEILDEMRVLRRLPEQADFKAWKETVLKQYTGLLEPVEEMWHLPDGTAYRTVTQPHPLGGLLLLVEDMTDTLSLQRSLSTLTAVQSETLENLHESIAVFGNDGKVRLCNHSFIDLWGLNSLTEDYPMLNGIHVHTILSKASMVFAEDALDTLSDLTDDMDPDSKARSLLYDLPAWISRREQQMGRWRSVDDKVIDYLLVPLPDGSCLLRQNDCTDSFRIQQALRERSQALEMTDRMKSEFIANMAYELRTPLNSIMGFSELLASGLYDALTPKQKDTMDLIRQASQDLNHLITNVLDIAVIDSGNVDLSLEEVDMAQIFSVINDMTADMVRRKNVILKLQSAKNLPTIQADKTRIKQAMYSLISALSSLSVRNNDIQLTLEGQQDQSLLLTAELNQIILDDLDFDSLIDALEQGRSVTTHGSGNMDLLIVRLITDLHKGKLTLNRTPDDRMILTLWLPGVQNTN